MSPALTDLEARLARLEDQAAIGALMQRYADASDAKHEATRGRVPEADLRAAAARQAACFAEDGIWEGGPFGGSLVGRAAIEGFFSATPWRFTAHLYTPAEIDVSGDDAEARWRLLEIGLHDASGHVLLLTGRAFQSLRRTPEGWRISRMGFAQLHAVTLSRDPHALRCLIPAGESIQ